MCVIYSYLGQK